MAFFRSELFSMQLEMATTVYVIIPDDVTDKATMPVVYLLHGLSDNASGWTRLTSIERYARENHVAVVMPEVQRSFYVDMKYGMKYYSYVAKELRTLVAGFFGLATDRAHSYIAGLSMGGYGALKIGLRCAQDFAGVAAFSAVCDMVCMMTETELCQNDRRELMAIYGSELHVEPEDDCFYLLEECAKLPKEQRPKVFQSCGTDDFLYGYNLKFKEKIEALDFDYRWYSYKEDHTWAFWDDSIQKAFAFFFPKSDVL